LRQLLVVRLINLQPVAARILGHVAGGIGIFQHFLHAGAFRGDGHEADADADIERPVLPHEAVLADLEAHGFGVLRRPVQTAPLQQHAELVAAEAREHVRVADFALQQRRHLLEQLVAGDVAAGVVDHLELVDVDITQRVLLVFHRRGFDGALQARLERAPVVAPGQRVVIGQAQQLLVLFLQTGGRRQQPVLVVVERTAHVFQLPDIHRTMKVFRNGIGAASVNLAQVSGQAPQRTRDGERKQDRQQRHQADDVTQVLQEAVAHQARKCRDLRGRRHLDRRRTRALGQRHHRGIRQVPVDTLDGGVHQRIGGTQRLVHVHAHTDVTEQRIDLRRRRLDRMEIDEVHGLPLAQQRRSLDGAGICRRRKGNVTRERPAARRVQVNGVDQAAVTGHFLDAGFAPVVIVGRVPEQGQGFLPAREVGRDLGHLHAEMLQLAQQHLLGALGRLLLRLALDGIGLPHREVGADAGRHDRRDHEQREVPRDRQRGFLEAQVHGGGLISRSPARRSGRSAPQAGRSARIRGPRKRNGSHRR
jgi:hypothetical protein